MKNFAKFSNNIVAAFVVLMICLLIIPLPTAILDFLFIFQIGLSLVILMMSMYVKEPLEFSIFPTLLLITTLFRLGLNISSTRSILTNAGYAGEVVKVFGQFVIRGNVAVGLVIFLIIVLVQMLVITKGSERVAEVTARFTLDAMPGKQMAIDADLNTGAITDAEAKIRRDKIQQESSFFGSMDGAVKYVKGDATAGLIITIINIVGGLALGVTSMGLSMNDALNKYTILTIGDGLVSQIPSMLISLSTGILVTKASKEENIGDILIGQLFNIPKVLLFVGITMIALGILTPLNLLFCAGYGLLFIIISPFLLLINIQFC